MMHTSQSLSRGIGWYNGTPVQRYSGTSVQRYNGTTVQRYFGSSLTRVLRLLVATALMALPCTWTGMLAQPFYCDMRQFDVDCTPQPLHQDLWVPISETPPCSVKVRVHGTYCPCKAIELLDMQVYFDDVQPAGCATRADVHNAFSQWAQFTGTAHQEIIKLIFSACDTSNCPSATSIVAATAVACRKPAIEWQVPTVNPPYWTTVVVNYDLSKPWSWYEFTKPPGAVNPVVGLVNCGASCCYQIVQVCWNGPEMVVTTTNPAPATDPCPVPNTDPNCRVFWCEP